MTRVGHLKTPNDAIGASTVPLAFRFLARPRKKPFTVYADDIKAEHGWLVALVRATREASREAKPIEELYQEEVAGGTGAWESLLKGLALARKLARRPGARRVRGDARASSDYVEARDSSRAAAAARCTSWGRRCATRASTDPLKRFTSLRSGAARRPEQPRLQSAWCMWRLGRADEANCSSAWRCSTTTRSAGRRSSTARAYLRRARRWAASLVDLQLVIGLGQQSAEATCSRAPGRRNCASPGCARRRHRCTTTAACART